MRYTMLGGSGLRISAIVVGTMTWGDRNSEEEAFAQLDLALELGADTFDTAELYPSPPRARTYGATETIIGRWLRDRGARDRVVLASKIGGRSNKDYLRPWGAPTRLDRRNLEAALDGSLRRLGTDRIDLYQLHWPDRKTNIFGNTEYRHDPADAPVPLEETLGALGDLVQAGKIRHIGVCNETPWGLMRLSELARGGALPRIASVQNAYSLVNRSVEAAHAEICHRETIGLLAYSPLGMGLLTGKYAHGQRPADGRLVKHSYYERYTVPEGLRAAEAYADLAHSRGLAPNQMALAYLLTRKPFVSGVIVGATGLDQLRSNLASVDLTLDDDTVAAIEAIHRAFPNPCP